MSLYTSSRRTRDLEALRSRLLALQEVRDAVGERVKRMSDAELEQFSGPAASAAHAWERFLDDCEAESDLSNLLGSIERYLDSSAALRRRRFEAIDGGARAD